MKDKFIYCFTRNAKEELLANGFKYVCEQHMGEQTVYVFNNDCDKLNFTLDKSKYVLDNKLFF